MKKIILPIFLLLISSYFASFTYAAKLEVSNNSNFGGDVKQFSAGDVVYVRIQSDSSGDKQKVLNLRKNDYSLLKTYNLNKSANIFTTSFVAPSESGYYSLEARIEAEGSSTVSVVTIKVGSVNGASIKVDVKSENLEKSTTSDSQSVENHQEDKEKIVRYGSQTSDLDKRIESEKIVNNSSWTFFVISVKKLFGLLWIF